MGQLPVNQVITGVPVKEAKAGQMPMFPLEAEQ